MAVSVFILGLQEAAEERGEAGPHDVLRSLWVSLKLILV